MSSSVVSVSSSSTAPPGTTFADVACFTSSPFLAASTTLHIELPARGPH